MRLIRYAPGLAAWKGALMNCCGVIGRGIRRGFAVCALGACLVSHARAQVLSESLGEGITRYFASPDARTMAVASYALASEPKPGPAPEHPSVVPVFTADDKANTATVTIAPGTSLYGTGEVA